MLSRMNLELDNKYFLVSGGSRGIGKSIAERLLSEGATVGLVARGKIQLNVTFEEFQQKFGDRVQKWSADCADETALLSVCREIEHKWGN